MDWIIAHDNLRLAFSFVFCSFPIGAHLDVWSSARCAVGDIPPADVRAFGMMMMSAAMTDGRHLFGLETLSIATYVMAGLRNPISIERVCD